MFIFCQQCQCRYKYLSEYEGKRVRCKRCNATFTMSIERATQRHDGAVPAPTEAAEAETFRLSQSQNKGESQVSTTRQAANAGSLPAKLSDRTDKSIANAAFSSSGSTWEQLSDDAKQLLLMQSFCGEFVKPQTAFSYRL